MIDTILGSIIFQIPSVTAYFRLRSSRKENFETFTISLIRHLELQYLL